MTNHSLTNQLSSIAQYAPDSKILEVMNAARMKDDIVLFTAGEGDLPTPQFIGDAADKALKQGLTYYTDNRGRPELREALARYHSKLYDQPFSSNQFFVTGSGMQSVQIALRLVLDVGDEIIIPTPAWPNFSAAAAIAGANFREVPMQWTQDGWHLDIEKMTSAVSPKTRVLFLNTPSNPTGWVMSHAQMRDILDFARKRGLWIIADEIYARFIYDGSLRAPSFLDIMDPEDRIIFVNTFSKNWAMTGWRMGWIMAHPSLGQKIENLIQYSTSGVAAFMQMAGVAALNDGDIFVQQMIDRAAKGRKIATDILTATNKVTLAPPKGAFYMLFGIDGYTDTQQLGLQLIEEAGVALSPGDAFGDAGRGYMRLCFLRSEQDLTKGVERLASWINKHV